MKTISFILGILILVLALKPCADGFCDDEKNDTEVCSKPLQDHEDNQDDSCAMLCACNCCGTLIISQVLPTFTLESKIPISTKVNSHYESHYRFAILSSIWQPPQFFS